LIEGYSNSVSYRMANADSFPSLDSFLNSTLGQNESQFNNETDAYLEKVAIENLNKMKAKKNE